MKKSTKKPSVKKPVQKKIKTEKYIPTIEFPAVDNIPDWAIGLHENNSSLFDMSDLSDIPDNVKKQINIQKNQTLNSKLGSAIIDLFKICNTLTINAIVVGLFRKFSIEKIRQQIKTNLAFLIKKEILKKLDRYTFELVEK